MKNWILTFMSLLLIILIQGCSKDSPVEPPQPEEKIEIASPANNAAVFDSVKIQVEITTEKTIAKVELLIDGNVDSTQIKFSQPYTFIWKIPGEPDSTVHTVQAKAYQSDNSVLASSIVNIISYKLTPGNLQVKSVSESGITLNWQYNSVIARGYFIEESIDDSAFVLVDSVKSNVNSITIPGPIFTNKDYAFRVRAKSDSVTGKYSNIVTAHITFDAPLLSRIDTESDTTITLSWQDSSSIRKSFEIERSTDGVSFTLIKTEEASLDDPQYTITMNDYYSLGQSYYFRIRTKSAYSLSPYSSILNISVPFESPSNLIIKSSTITKIVLKWKNSSRFSKTYCIEKQAGTQDYTEIGVVNGNAFTDTVLDASQINNYRVRAQNDKYYSGYSNSLPVQFKFSKGYTIMHTMTGHSGDVGNVAITSNDRIIASISSDRSVKLWDAGSGNLLRTIYLGSSVFGSAPPMSIFDNFLAAAYSQNAIKIYDINTGNVLKTLTTSNANLITGLSFSTDGKYLGAVNTGNLTVWQVSDWSVILEKNGDLQYSVSFSPDDQYVASGSTLNGNVTVYNIATQKISATLSSGNYAPIWAVTFSPDGENIAFGGGSGQVYVYPSKGGTLIERLNYHGLAITCLAYSPDGNLLANGGNMGEVDVWQDGALYFTLFESLPPNGLAFNHDSRFLVTGNWDHNVRLYKANGIWSSSK